MHYLLFYEVGDDYVAQRARYRDEHLVKARKAAQRGELVLGGALADPVDGAVLLFKGESPRAAEEFARSDPYVIGGAVKKWYVREWTTVAGQDAATPEQADSRSSSETAEKATDVLSGPVLRMWKGRSSPDKAGDYVQHAIQKVFPQLGSIEGHKGAYLLRRSVGDTTEFLVLTLWDSMEAVRTFAGTQPSKAVVEPPARAALTDFDELATHYEVVIRTLK